VAFGQARLLFSHPTTFPIYHLPLPGVHGGRWRLPPPHVPSAEHYLFTYTTLLCVRAFSDRCHFTRGVVSCLYGAFVVSAAIAYGGSLQTLALGRAAHYFPLPCYSAAVLGVLSGVCAEVAAPLRATWRYPSLATPCHACQLPLPSLLCLAHRAQQQNVAAAAVGGGGGLGRFARRGTCYRWTGWRRHHAAPSYLGDSPLVILPFWTCNYPLSLAITVPPRQYCADLPAQRPILFVRNGLVC